LAKRRQKEYFCTVMSENVEIALKKKLSLSRELKNELFVQCNQVDCQYVGLNQSPCPLRVDLFTEEVEKWGGERRVRRMEF
jgi:hypothetical protein